SIRVATFSRIVSNIATRCLEQTGCPSCQNDADANRRCHNRSMLVTATPWALFWPAAMVVWGPGLTCATHRHHAIQLVMALTGTVRIRSGPDQRWRRCAAALVRPDAPHEVDAGGAQILFAFVESESDLGAALLERVSASIDFIDDATVKTWRNDLGEVSTLTSERVEPWIRTHLLSGRQTPKIHPKVRCALQELRQALAVRSEERR